MDQRLQHPKETEHIDEENRESKLSEIIKRARLRKELGRYEQEQDYRPVDLMSELAKIRKDLQIILYEIASVRKQIERNRKYTSIEYVIFLTSVFVVIANLTSLLSHFGHPSTKRLALKESARWCIVYPLMPLSTILLRQH